MYIICRSGEVMRNGILKGGVEAQGGVDQLVRKGKVRHRVSTRSWVGTLGKSSPPKWGIPAGGGDFGLVGSPKGAGHRRL